ncbi:MAG: hypothetical protein FJ028_00885 [Chloroflexi bacterium]|nr:hypothetical protein [Chloroflexota bacterium]
MSIENTLREAFVAAGSDVRERRTVSGRAFPVDGRALGQFEERAGVLRVRPWLGDRERASFEGRPTFDRESGWLHLVSDDDVRFVAGLVPAAYEAASSGRATPPSASTVEMPTAADVTLEEKKGAASPRRPSARTTRSR